MRVTIKKIAEVAGVSRGTVDRALNGRPGVRPEVEENIKRIASELGYKPNPAAKALADKRYTTKKIGVLFNSEGNPFFDEVIRGAKAALTELAEFGMLSVIKTMKGYDAETQIKLLDELLLEGVNGIVLTPINRAELAEKINQIKQQGIEVVTVNSDVLGASRLAYVGCRYKKSGTVAAGLIGMMNCGRVEKYAIVGSSESNLAVVRRVQGLMETLLQDFPMIKIADMIENQDNDEISYQLISDLLKNRDDLDGICFAGAGSEGGIRAIQESGKTLKIVTFDLTEGIRRLLKEGLIAATVCQEPYKQGFDGIEILGKYLLWNQRPKKELNHTQLTIVTKYSI